MRYKLTREVASDECSWLDKIYEKGSIVYLHKLNSQHSNQVYMYFANTESEANSDKPDGFSLPINSVRKIS